MIMKNDFALDLKTARKRSGLTQEDCAYLMGCDATKLTRLERGNTLPGLRDVLMLGLIYGRTFESLFAHILRECRMGLASTLESLPEGPPNWAGRARRQHSLNRLAADLADYTHQEHGNA